MTRNVKIKVILLFWLGDVPKAKMAAPELRRFPPELLLFRFKNIFLSFFFRIRILKNELKSIGFAEIWSSRTLGKIVTEKKKEAGGGGDNRQNRNRQQKLTKGRRMLETQEWLAGVCSFTLVCIKPY